ncbi:fimbria/pilus outer membrane usher protein [Escherichia coli]|uniref:fimbria/pilus outer membrane usher protein n=1 Tax=Escherichia coli TaxID=562 RepID=UPI0010CB1B79|nr:fimbria/pilus outer membrane usher protein [Escherichia coli]GDH54591.1 outer membrane usher protein FimD [Escherichia coli]
MTAIRAAFKAYRMHQVLIMPRFARLTIALGLATAVFPVDAEYYFNPRFLSNDLAESVDLSAFTKGREAPPGTYRVDIYLNDEFMTSRDITFIADDNNAELIPCLSTDLLVSLGIKKSALLDNKEHSAEKHVPDNSACTPLQDRLADASTEFDVGQQHLSLSVPQIYVGRMARGYVSPDLWEEGINAGLLNYSFNGNSINNRSNHNAGKSNYAYLNLQSGINIGSWRLRDNSTWSYNSGSSNSSDSNKWQHINTSAERDIIPLRSRLTVGDSYTDGDIFDSVNFRGLKINSTEAMLPDSQHGFAPVIHGIARGTAQVSVKQNGFATEYRENRVALNANSLADNVELDETVVTVIPTHGAIARATFNAQIGGKVLMTLKYGNKSVPFGAIVTHGENKNGSIVAENGQVYLTGLPQSGKLQVSWGNDKNSNCIVDYKLPEVSPGTLLNQQTAICR